MEMRDLPEEPGPRYTAREYSRKNIEAMVDDALGPLSSIPRRRKNRRASTASLRFFGIGGLPPSQEHRGFCQVFPMPSTREGKTWRPRLMPHLGRGPF